MEKPNELVHVFDSYGVKVKTYSQDQSYPGVTRVGFVHEIEFSAENGLLTLTLFDNVFTPNALRRWADTLEVSMADAQKKFKSSK